MEKLIKNYNKKQVRKLLNKAKFENEYEDEVESMSENLLDWLLHPKTYKSKLRRN